MLQKIKIYGEAKEKSIPKLASMSKNTSGSLNDPRNYGQRQERETFENKETSTKEIGRAVQRLKYEYIVTAISNPKIKRGDTVYVGCGTAGLKGNKTVKSITHDCVAGTMDVVFY